jgi:CHAD domain-containing protein
LGELRKDLAEEIFDGLTWDDIRDNYEACHRSGRRRMRESQETLEDDACHRWRKRVKALYYQSQALSEALAHPGHRLERTRKLGKLLGSDHDLTLLEKETAATSADNPWDEAISERREKLRRQIFTVGGRIYEQPSHRFARMRKPPI